MSKALEFLYHDGGRSGSRYRKENGDCVIRSISIASGTPYEEVYRKLAVLDYIWRRENKKRNPEKGFVKFKGIMRPVYVKYLVLTGWKYYSTYAKRTFTMRLSNRHFQDEEVYLVLVSRHLTCIIVGVIVDTFHPSMKGTRGVYGYFVKEHDVQPNWSEIYEVAKQMRQEDLAPAGIRRDLELAAM